RARRPHGGPAGRMGQGQQLPPADRRLHGWQIHGRRRDERHVLRPRRNDRRGQRGHGDREDLPPRSRGHPRRRADRRDPRRRQGKDRSDRLMAETLNKVFIDVEVEDSIKNTPPSPPSSKKSAPSTSSRTPAAP